MKKLLTVLVILLLPAFANASTWQIDPDHSNVGFKVRHLMVANVKGVFHKVAGQVVIDDKEIAKSKVTATIETASIDTGVERRDADLRSPKFLDVAKYPTMTFVSTNVAKTGSDKLQVTGDLTLHGVTRTVVLDVEGPTSEVKDPRGNQRRGASATTKLNRKDFGLKWNKAMDSLVGDEIAISIEVELVESSGN